MAAVKSSALSDSSSDDERSHRSSFNIPQKIGIQVSVIQENHGAKRVAQSETSNVIKYPPKKRKIENAPESSGPKYSNISKNIMEKMGYKDGLGLGKHEQGRVNIVEASQQKGRRGLGLRLPNLEMSGKDWDFEKEEVVVEETVNWMPECSETPPTIKEMRQWMQEGPKKLTIDNETEFCGQEILQRVLKNKSVFDMLMAEEMRGARTRSNPYETIRGGIFLNRAAMKMANMDCVFDFMFTSPKTENADEVLKPLDLLYFADLCSGPGGFSEYVLWRKKWDTKGFGFTLRGANDFKLEDFFSGPCEPFEPHYGVNGKEGDGDIFVEENLRNFRKFVLESTDNTGVHFVMADGGFSVEGQENIQEILSKQLYLCQFLCALGILRDGGHFVCKVFDLFTPFSVGLVYLLYRAFKKVCIHKPVTSRPANSERYVVCKWYRKDEAKDIRDYLFEVNCELNRMKGVTSNKDIVQVVPLELMRKDPEFCDYITQSNEFLAEYQVLHLQKIQVFVQNTGLHEDRQSEVRKQCLQLWKVPDNVRSAPLRSDPANKALDILQVERSGMPSQSTNVLNLKGLTNIKGIYDYYCVVSAFRTENRSNRTLILGLGRKHVYKWETGSGSRKWTKMELNIEIPDDTLLLAEEVQELRGEGKAQKKMTALHVIDAAKLGGKDVSKLSYIERIEWIKKFLKAIAKPSRPDVAAIRMKEIFRLDSLESIFDRLSEHCVKGQRGMPRLCYSCDNEKYFVPYGVLLFRVTVDPWIAAFSQRNQKVYYFNTKSKESSYEFPNEAVASFSAFFKNFIFWEWTEGVEASISGNMKDASKVSKDAFMDFIIEKLKAAA